MKPLTQGKVEILPWGTISPLLLRAFANQLQDCQKKPTTGAIHCPPWKTHQLF